MQADEPRAKRLEGCVAIVTGAASGIGRASAGLFAAHGADVLGVDLPERGLPEAMDEIGARALQLDIAAPGAAESIVVAALDGGERLDILMNNAGTSSRQKLEDIADEEWHRILEVNLHAAFRLCRQAGPWLRRSGRGRIINVSSVMAQVTDHGLAAYSASKAGLAGLTRNLALDMGRDGVTCNHIMPGAILTGMTQAGFSNPEIAEVWARKSPFKRLGEPLDVARVALFLASLDGGFVTGQGIAADGGMTLRG